MSKFDKLKKWLNIKDNLIMMDKDTRGIMSTKDIHKGDIIMEIPSKYLIELSYCTKYVSKILDHTFDNTNSIIAIYLLLESLNSKTKWKHYIDVFPEDFSSYIFYYDKDKKELLKHSTMMCKDIYYYEYTVNNVKNDALVVYEVLKKRLPEKYLNIKEFVNLFIKFRIIVDSRTFSYEKNNEIENGMCPYADLFNHSNKSNIFWYFDDNKKSFIVQAFEDIKKNSEIYFSYGDRSNVHLVIHYGFTLKNNPYSDLSFMFRNNKITSSKNSNLDFILELFNFIQYKDKIIKYLREKLLLHEASIKKTKDYNIRNILHDEIRILRSVLNNPKHSKKMNHIDISKNLNY